MFLQLVPVGIQLVNLAEESSGLDALSDAEKTSLFWFEMASSSTHGLLWFILTCFNRDWRVLEQLSKVHESYAYSDITLETPNKDAADGDDGVEAKKERTPEEYAGLLSRLCFAWLDPLMRTGYSKTLEDSDFYRILARDESEVLAAKFSKAWKEVVEERAAKKRAQSPEPDAYQALPDEPEEPAQGDLSAVLKALHRAGVLNPFYEAAVFKLLYDTLNFASPQLLHEMIRFMSDETQPAWHGYLYALGMLSAAAVQTFTLHVYFHRVFRAGMRVRSALVTAIYRKSLVLTPSARQDRTTGEVVNLMSADCARMQALFPYLHITWSSPYVICLSMFFIWQQLKYAVFVAVGVILIVITPLTALVASNIKRVQKTVMKRKDERIRVTGETVTSIKAIKLYGWERAFRDIVHDARKEELQAFRRFVLWRAVGRMLWVATPVIVTLVTFGSFVLLQNGHLDSATAFTSLTLLNILRFPLAMLPNILNGAMEASVSLRRIASFFDAPELSTESLIQDKDDTDDAGSSAEMAIKVTNGNFYWDDACLVPALRNVELRVPRGGLCIVTGEVGSGKTALLLMLIRALQPCKSPPLPVMRISGSVAYANQVPWIQNASLRDNILFGSAYDKEWYRRVVFACALTSDLENLVDGDRTEIGERGINLSGGQKARVALARAVYSRADVLLLETCFEAVDEHVGRHLWRHCFQGLLKEVNPFTGRCRTVVLVTHALKHLPDADMVVVMHKGIIAAQGPFDEVNRSGRDEVQAVMRSLVSREAKITGEDEDEDEGNVEEDNRAAFAKAKRVLSSLSADGRAKADGAAGSGNLTGEEERAVGQVSFKVYQQYIAALGGPFVLLLICFGLSLSTAVDFLRSRWLAYWSEKASSSGNNHHHHPHVNASGSAEMLQSFTVASHHLLSPRLLFESVPLVSGVDGVFYREKGEDDSMYYLGVYAGLSIFACVCIGCLVVLVAMVSLRASRVMHEKLVVSITRAPMSFFDTVPIGRILNRFSKDMYTIDETLPSSTYSFLSTTFSVIGTVFTIAYVSPMFLVAIPFLAVAYRYIQRYYIATSREVKRWDSVLRSPIYSFFTETLDGASTIRAYAVEDRFIATNQSQLDKNLEAYYLSIAANRWLAVRLEFIGNFLVFAAALFVATRKGQIDPSLAGLALSYALGITQTLNWTVRMVSEMETNIVSVERVNEYIQVAPEAPEEVTDPRHVPKASWPTEGHIIISDLYARYRPNLDDVLKGLNLEIQPGEKVGIVGRTGAGKSSLMLVLLRLVEPRAGRIVIDGYNIQDLGLRQLRSKLAIIPQDPVMFNGTLRRNLDPNGECVVSSECVVNCVRLLDRSGEFTDEEIWKALELTQLKPHILSLEEEESSPLEVKIAEGECQRIVI